MITCGIRPWLTSDAEWICFLVDDNSCPFGVFELEGQQWRNFVLGVHLVGREDRFTVGVYDIIRIVSLGESSDALAGLAVSEVEWIEVASALATPLLRVKVLCTTVIWRSSFLVW